MVVTSVGERAGSLTEASSYDAGMGSPPTVCSCCLGRPIEPPNTPRMPPAPPPRRELRQLCTERGLDHATCVGKVPPRPTPPPHTRPCRSHLTPLSPPTPSHGQRAIISLLLLSRLEPTGAGSVAGSGEAREAAAEERARGGKEAAAAGQVPRPRKSPQDMFSHISGSEAAPCGIAGAAVCRSDMSEAQTCEGCIACSWPTPAAPSEPASAGTRRRGPPLVLARIEQRVRRPRVFGETARVFAGSEAAPWHVSGAAVGIYVRGASRADGPKAAASSEPPLLCDSDGAGGVRP
jgi:hypothetical protein